MAGRLFPKQIDNDYRGSWVAAGILGLVSAVKALQGIESLFNTRETAIRADGIALDTFGAAAAQEVVVMFALLGFYLTVVPLLNLIVLIRYRSAIPLMFLTLIWMQLGVRAVAMWRGGAPLLGPHPIGFYVNLAILAVTILGFALSLRERGLRSS